MPNIRILAKGVLQIFVHKVVPIQNGCVWKKGSNYTENLRNRFKIQSVHLHLSMYLYAKYQDPCQIGSLDILFTRLFLYKMPYVRKRGITQSKIYGIGSKVDKFIYTLICTYMQNIRILAKVVLQIFCSQGCSYTKCLCSKKGNNSTENLRNRFKS